MNNKYYLIALNRMNHVGPRTVAKFLTRWPQLEELFRLNPSQLTKAGLPLQVVESITTFNLEQVEADLRWQEQENHWLLTWEDAAYPALLKEIHDPPIALYAMGQIVSLKQRCVSMVGTRNPSATGGETARKFAYELAKHCITIVSGLALGIDAQAHQGSLDADGKTIAVMGTGIDVIYPRRHRQLAEKICQNGLLISEFPLQTAPNAGHFPRRNRIISGLSSITMVVEAAIKSGSLITARLACEQNRDVLAIPGSIHNPQSRGCHYLLQQGAKLVTSSLDVLEELGMDCNLDQIQISPERLADENQNLVKCIGFELTTIDQISERSGLTIEAVMCELVELELLGVVRAIPGGYERCRI